MNHILTIIMNITNSFGYLGIFLITMLEYACLPLPSEVILPFVGFGIANGKYNFILVFICVMSAAMAGALISYAIGYLGGDSIINWLKEKVPRSEKPIKSIEFLFVRYGKLTIFLTRVMPFTRTHVSLFAGVEKVNKFIFIAFSAMGIAIWNFGLLIIGYYLGSNMDIIESVIKKYSILCVSAIIIASLIFIYKRYFKKARK